MSRSVQIIDTTFRDGHQSLWATRMTTAMMLGMVDQVDRAGYQMVEVSAAVNFDSCVRYLKEDPWERLRLMRKHLVRTPIHALMRSLNWISFDIMPDDIMELTYTRLHANGVSRMMIFDGLHDPDNYRLGVELCKRLGMYVEVAVTFSISPVHTDEYYGRKARELLALGADALLLKDPAALLTVDRVRTLVPVLKQAAAGRPLEVHSHCLTGLGPLVLLESVEQGADALYTCIPPLSDGASHPSVFDIVHNLRLKGYDVPLDVDPIREASEYLTSVARNEGLPVGQIARHDLFHYQHQIPGGVISNLKRLLADAGMGDRIQEVLEEIPRVREELGWPVMVSPYSQFVAVQALMNVMHGERYRVVLDEIAKWVYGYYGRQECTVAPEAMDRISERASKRISPKPASPEPILPALRNAYPEANDDELVLRGFFKGAQVDQMLAAQPMSLAYQFQRDLSGLVKRLVGLSDSGRVAISTAGLEFAWQR